MARVRPTTARPSKDLLRSARDIQYRLSFTEWYCGMASRLCVARVRPTTLDILSVAKVRPTTLALALIYNIKNGVGETFHGTSCLR